MMAESCARRRFRHNLGLDDSMTAPEPQINCVTNASETDSDASLVTRGQAGDRDAHRQLYELYGPKVFRLMVRMVGSQDAVDLTQQVFLQVYRKMHQFAGNSKFGTWLYRVAVNEALQYRRRQQNRPVTQPLLSDVPSRKKGGEAFEARESLEFALAAIEPELREIFLLREVEQLSYDTLAEVLEMPAGTVASRLNRARRELKAALEPLDPT